MIGLFILSLIKFRPEIKHRLSSLPLNYNGSTGSEESWWWDFFGWVFKTELHLSRIFVDFWKPTCQDCLPEGHGIKCNISTLLKQIPPKLCFACVPLYFYHISYFFQVNQCNTKIKEITKICWKNSYIIFFMYKKWNISYSLFKKLLQSSSDGHVTWTAELAWMRDRWQLWKEGPNGWCKI